MRLFLLAFVLFSLQCAAQQKTTILNKTKIGPITCEYQLVATAGKQDTAKFIYISFRNMKYERLIDIGSIIFSVKTQRDEVAGMAKELSTALDDMGKKQTITWNHENYVLAIYDFDSNLYLKEVQKDAYTRLSKAEVQKLIQWLGKINY